MAARRVRALEGGAVADHAERAARARALDRARRPESRTADDVALHARDRETIEALVAAGRTLDSVIATADRTRLAAILDAVETSDDVLPSSEGDALVDERTAAIFDGSPRSTTTPGRSPTLRLRQHRATIFADTAEQGVPGMRGKTALYSADSSAYDLVAAPERQVDVAAIGQMLRVLA